MITILALGKTKPVFVKEGIQEYLKRLNKYVPLKYQEVEKLPKLKGYVIALEVQGKQYDSKAFSIFLKKQMLEQKDLTFIIGSENGFENEFLKTVQEKISLSTMTFPHELVRVIFLEQLYRAFTLINNEPYHK